MIDASALSLSYADRVGVYPVAAFPIYSVKHLAYALRARAPEMPPNSHQQPTTGTSTPPANMKLTRTLNPRATHGDRGSLVMRRSLVSDEDLGAEAPTALRVSMVRLLKSAEAYH